MPGFKKENVKQAILKLTHVMTILVQDVCTTEDKNKTIYLILEQTMFFSFGFLTASLVFSVIIGCIVSRYRANRE